MNRPARSQHIRRGEWIVSFLVAVGLLVLLVAPSPISGRLMETIFDLSHAPVFFVVVYFLARLLCRSDTRVRRAFIIWAAVIALGTAGELLQQLSGREAGWHDGIANVIGATLGLVAFLWPDLQSRSIRTFAAGTMLVALVLVSWTPLRMLTDVLRQQYEFPLIASFEDDLELSRWVVRYGSIERTQNHAEHGQWTLQWQLDPAQFSYLQLHYPPRDWSGFDVLEFDLWLDEDEPLDLFLKIEDQSHNGRMRDRYHQELHLVPGKTTVRVPLAAVRSAPASRRMDLRGIRKFELFGIDVTESRRVTLDRFELVQESG